MQIVIELSDKTYKEINEENGIYGTDNGLSARITGKVVGAIQSGTPFPEEIIKTSEQEPKTGHWILADEQNKEDVENDNYRFICSECQCSDIHAKGTKVPYCWNCGTKMAESEVQDADSN